MQQQQPAMYVHQIPPPRINVQAPLPAYSKPVMQTMISLIMQQQPYMKLHGEHGGMMSNRVMVDVDMTMNGDSNLQQQGGWYVDDSAYNSCTNFYLPLFQ